MDIQGAEDKLMTTGSNAEGEIAQVVEEGTEVGMVVDSQEDGNCVDATNSFCCRIVLCCVIIKYMWFC